MEEDERCQEESDLWTGVFTKDDDTDDDAAFTALFAGLRADAVIVAGMAAGAGLALSEDLGSNKYRFLSCIPLLNLPAAVTKLADFEHNGMKWLRSSAGRNTFAAIRGRNPAGIVKPRAYDSTAQCHGTAGNPVEQAEALNSPLAARLGMLTTKKPTEATFAALVQLLLEPAVPGDALADHNLVILRGVVQYVPKKMSAEKADKEGSAERLWNDLIAGIQVFIASWGYAMLRSMCSVLAAGNRRVNVVHADEAMKLIWQLDVKVFTKHLWRFTSYRTVFAEELTAEKMLVRPADFEEAISTLCKLLGAVWGPLVGDNLGPAVLLWMKQYDRMNRDCSSWEGGWWGIYEQIPLPILEDLFTETVDYFHGGAKPKHTWAAALTLATMNEDHIGLADQWQRNVRWMTPRLKMARLNVNDLASPEALDRAMSGHPTSARSPTTNQPLCYGCQQPGHRQANCPEKKQKGGKGKNLKRPANEDGQPKVIRGSLSDHGGQKCHNCKEVGHLSRDCPEDPICNGWRDSGVCGYGKGCRFGHPPKYKNVAGQAPSANKKQRKSPGALAMQAASEKLGKIAKTAKVEKPYFCLHKSMTGGCKHDDDECTRVSGRAIKHADNFQLPEQVKLQFAETEEAQALLGAAGACTGLRRLTAKVNKALIDAVDEAAP